MPNDEEGLIVRLCQERITTEPRVGLPLDAVVDIVRRNLARNRFRLVAAIHSATPPFDLKSYVDLVVTYIVQEHPRVAALERGEPAAWQAVLHLLVGRAKGMLRQLHVDGDWNERSLDLASETCRVIVEQPYPYDVAFEAWITTILKRIILAHAFRSTDAMTHGRAASLDAERPGKDGTAIRWEERIADTQAEQSFERVEHQVLLTEAIAQLRSSDQRRVIRYSYLDQLSDDVIAARLGKSKQAVYNLRNRALVKLRFILSRPHVRENPKLKLPFRLNVGQIGESVRKWKACQQPSKS